MKTHWPRTPVEIGGHRYDLCFNLGAIAEAQREFDRRGHDVNLLEAFPALNLANVRILFPCAVRKYHPDLDFASAQQLVTWEAIYAVAGALRGAWRAAAPDPLQGEAGKRKAAHSTKPRDPLTRDQQWQRLWSLALYDLRLTTSEFYDLTVGQLDALIRRHERATQDREFLFGQLASIGVNFSMAHPKEPVRPRDFMPSEWAKNPDPEVVPKRRRKRQLIATEIRSTMEHWLRRGERG